ncbi:ABC transporter permease [Microbacterium sp.]|uniref:ABC transporter permease n=1 Tax=Microbacterium sp. TaxID=51671 RepID=UPI003341286C
MTSVIGALADAWAEIRVHKMRVLLSLIGIAVSVGALTAVVALTDYGMQNTAESADRWGGRSATIAIAPMSESGVVDTAAFDERVVRVSERYGFTHVARSTEGIQLLVQAPDGVRSTETRLLDPDYAVIHREKLLEGREFRASDAEALSPPVIISEAMWDRLGRVPLAQHPTIEIVGAGGGVYQVVGVRAKEWRDDQTVRMDVLFDGYASRVEQLPEGAAVRWDVWVSSEAASRIGPVLAMDLRAGLPSGQQVMVSRTDAGAQPGFEEQQQMLRLITGGIGVLVLGLGALSLINIQLVAMRQRVREIGVRRAFGATGGRVFTAVLLESLVATTVAGVIGIAVTIAVLRSPWVLEGMFPALVDVPPFPMGAAVTGLVSAVVVGAVAGFVPALVALRVKVIDAIRF